ncbi:MAG TPA: hypothetical protein PKD20_01415 [Candidatus Saccharibacteria bacterium]|jgi:hypothetical protein|nr:hypothetical protein [Candidatus Saccharibacteria bacterium]HMT55516.1 hypothetical protein [Candidatus Saccharibacteria bacterium]
MKHVELPVVYTTEKGRGAHGKFRYPEHHLIEIAGKPAVKKEIVPEGSVLKESSIIVPAIIVERLGEIAAKLADGMDQSGLYTGRNAVTNNCARFIQDIAGVDFDKRMLESSDVFNNWRLQAQPEGHVPIIGEVVTYTRPHSGNWSHWAMGVEGTDPELTGVMGLGGVNGHAISIAENWDVAKAQGHTQPNTAVHPSYSHLS